MNKRVLQVLVLLLLVAAISIGIIYRDVFDVQLLEQWIDQAGWWAPVLFMLIYIIATVSFLPGSVLTLAGGVLFGPILGTLYNLTGATIGAALSFLIARHLASDYVAERSAGKLKQLINGVEGEGWRFVAFVRLVPLFPFNLLNYALGLTKIRFIEYFLASYIFMLPGAIAYTYLGYAGRQAASGDDVIKTLLIALALLAIVMFLPRFIATIRRGPSIDVKQLKQLLDKKLTVVLDVRTEEELLKAGRIEQAIKIPVEQLEDELSKLDAYVSKSISIIGQTEKPAIKAANLLMKHGFEDVRMVQGGMTAWLKHNDVKQHDA